MLYLCIFMHGTANVVQEMPTPEANNSADCSRQVKVCLDDVVLNAHIQ